MPKPTKATLGRVHLVKKRLSELKPAPYNPRKMSKEAAAALDESVSRYGLVEPIVWNKRTKRVVGGHQRLAGLRRRGVKVTDVVVVDLPPIEEKTLNLALNSPSLGGEFTPAVAEILAEIRVDLPEVIEPLLLGCLDIGGGGAEDGALTLATDAVPGEKPETQTCPKCGFEFAR